MIQSEVPHSKTLCEAGFHPERDLKVERQLRPSLVEEFVDVRLEITMFGQYVTEINKLNCVETNVTQTCSTVSTQTSYDLQINKSVLTVHACIDYFQLCLSSTSVFRQCSGIFESLESSENVYRSRLCIRVGVESHVLQKLPRTSLFL